MKTEHTPGPYVVQQVAPEKLQIKASVGVVLADVTMPERHEEEVRRTALLMSRAPTMLNALRIIEDVIGQSNGSNLLYKLAMTAADYAQGIGFDDENEEQLRKLAKQLKELSNGK